MNIPEQFTCVATRRHKSEHWIEAFNSPITYNHQALWDMMKSGVIIMANRHHDTHTELLVKAAKAKRK